MAFQQILSGRGPLPIKIQFSLPVDGPVDFFITSTAWTQAANSFMGIHAEVNGQSLGFTNLFANPTAQHMSLPTLFGTAPINDPSAQQTLTITAATPETVTDSNDFFNVWVQY